MVPVTKGVHAYGVATLACGDACKELEGEAETKLHSIHKGGRGHGAMANSRHSIEGKHGTLLRLQGEDNNTVSWNKIKSS